MKLHFQKKRLYIYVNFIETDRFKIAPLFEDYDETFINYNYDSMKKAIEYILVGWKKKKGFSHKKEKKNFYDEFFVEKGKNKSG